MRLRLLLSFLIGCVLFTVLLIYAPPILLQTTDMPPFLLGLGAGVVAGAVMALIIGPFPRPNLRHFLRHELGRLAHHLHAQAQCLLGLPLAPSLGYLASTHRCERRAKRPCTCPKSSLMPSWSGTLALWPLP